MQRWLGICFTLLLLVAGSAAASAQEATPTAGFTVANPDLCQVEPRSVDELASFIATQPPDYATPGPVDPPAGEPADADTVESVTATVVELYACLNANDFMRSFSLFTDDALARGFMEDEYTQETIDTFSTPTAPMPTEAWVALEDVTILDDGRIGAIVVERIPGSRSDDYRIYMIFAEQDGRYLIDNVLQLEEE